MNSSHGITSTMLHTMSTPLILSLLLVFFHNANRMGADAFVHHRSAPRLLQGFRRQVMEVENPHSYMDFPPPHEEPWEPEELVVLEEPPQPVHHGDPPLAALVDIPKTFYLAETPEDHIPLEENQRLVCVGDVHGDVQALQEFLTLAGVLEMVEPHTVEELHETKQTDNEKETSFSSSTIGRPEFSFGNNKASKPFPKWTGKNTILVQCGDILDRGSSELACFELLATLSQQAVEEGGKVIVLYGNHEAMNSLGLFRFAESDKEYEQVMGSLVDEQLMERLRDPHETFPRMPMWRAQYVGNQPARWATYEPEGLLAKPLLANLKVAVQVGRTVCVHAGLTADHLRHNGGISGMNHQARAFVLGDTLVDKVTHNNQGLYPTYQQPWVEAEHRQTTYINSVPDFLGPNGGESSPVWMRDYSSPSDAAPRNPQAKAMLDDALAEVGNCDRMVMGHTVQKKINAALDGKAWRIDVGASQGVTGGTPEVLEIVKKNGKEEVNVITKDGKVSEEDRHVFEMMWFF